MGRRGALEVLLSAEAAGEGATRLVLRALRHGRGRLDLLPAAGRVDGAGLGRADAGRFHDAHQGVRPHDAASGQGRGDPRRPARGDARGRARPRRPPAARAPGRDLPPVPRGARTPALGGQARRDPHAAASVHRLQGVVARLSRVGARAARRGRDAGRVPPPLVARRREPRCEPRLPRAHRRRVRRGRRPALGHGAQPRSDRRRDDVPDRLRPLPRPQPRHLEQARRLGGRAVRLSLLRRGARRVDRAAARAGRPVRAGVRILQQQRVVRGSRQPTRPRLAGCDERLPAAAAPRRRTGSRRAAERERPLDRARRGCRPRAVRTADRRGRTRARGMELRARRGAADARPVRRGDRLGRLHASRPGRPVPVAARGGRVAARRRRESEADARDLPRLGAARTGDGCVGRAASGTRNRVVRDRADGGRPPRIRSSRRCPRSSTG